MRMFILIFLFFIGCVGNNPDYKVRHFVDSYQQTTPKNDIDMTASIADMGSSTPVNDTRIITLRGGQQYDTLLKCSCNWDDIWYPSHMPTRQEGDVGHKQVCKPLQTLSSSDVGWYVGSSCTEWAFEPNELYYSLVQAHSKEPGYEGEHCTLTKFERIRFEGYYSWFSFSDIGERLIRANSPYPYPKCIQDSNPWPYPVTVGLDLKLHVTEDGLQLL